MPNYNPYQQNGNYYYFVNGVEGAKAFQLTPNQTVMLMDSDHPVCYMKSTNSIGQPTLRYFKLEEVDENTIKTLATPVMQNAGDFVSKEDFNKLSNKIDELFKKLSEGKSNESI